MQDFRCAKCQKLLARYRNCQMLEVKCPRCGQINKLNSVYLTDEAKEITCNKSLAVK
ncbi:Com family DNA-binding transcriptional regulator [Desulfotomaculum sp. 1211_IL3151]|uniref:Com family DNA-binding transcriptional regulator n=1 Tax=Desulfotomaculum sp. 1211_IL3151 TaxID=3084055 RepID=UPI002FDB79AD